MTAVPEKTLRGHNLFESEERHTVIVDMSVKEFEGGDSVNEITFRMVRDVPYLPLTTRLIEALGQPFGDGDA